MSQLFLKKGLKVFPILYNNYNNKTLFRNVHCRVTTKKHPCFECVCDPCTPQSKTELTSCIWSHNFHTQFMTICLPLHYITPYIKIFSETLHENTKIIEKKSVKCTKWIEFFVFLHINNVTMNKLVLEKFCQSWKEQTFGRLGNPPECWAELCVGHKRSWEAKLFCRCANVCTMVE